MKLGDTVEIFAKPFAQAMHLDCLDEQGNLRPESRCGKNKVFLNNLSDSAWDFLWPTVNKKET